MKNLFLILFVLGTIETNAQQTTPLIKLVPSQPAASAEPDMKTFNLYNPYESVDSAIKAAQKIAAKEGKHIFYKWGVIGVFGAHDSMPLRPVIKKLTLLLKPVM